MPGETTVPREKLGKETENVKRRKRRSATEPRQRAAGRQGQAHRSGSSRRSGPPVICASLQKQYAAELDAVQEAYPGTKVWHKTEGLWLLTESTILSGLGKKATFLTAIPYRQASTAKSWGFWTTAISAQWIGPRHTNFPDGSVCAFELRDETWVMGDSIVTLLDLYSVWACRHFHLETFGRWPGRQAVHHPFERLTELNDDEFCGCDGSGKLYRDCCKKHDLDEDRIALAADFRIHYCDGLRSPPELISKFVRYGGELPPFVGLLWR